MDKDNLIKLVREYKAGKKSALGNIYNQTVRKTYSYVYSRVGNTNWTEDIVSETYLTLINILERYDESSKLETFIIGIASNKIKQFFSKLNELGTLNEEEVVIIEDEDLEETVNYKELNNQIKNILDKLPEDHKKVLMHRFINCETIKMTAEKLKMTEANVRVIQHRALKKAAEIANKNLSNNK